MALSGFDILIAIILLWALYRGFRDGVIIQLGGIAALFLGTYFAFRFGATLGRWLQLDSSYSTAVGFIIVLLGVIIAVSILGRLFSGIANFAGLAILNKIGGIILGGLKVALILGLLIYSFDHLNRRLGWVEQKSIDRSVLYRPLISVAHVAFPYIDFVKKQLINPTEPPKIESESIEEGDDGNRIRKI